MSQPFLGQVWGFAQPPAPAAMNPLDAGAAAAGYGPAVPLPTAVQDTRMAAMAAPPPILKPPPAEVPMSSPNEDPSRMMSIAPPSVSGGAPPVPPGVGMGVEAGPPRPPAVGTASNVGGEQFGLVRAGDVVIKVSQESEGATTESDARAVTDGRGIVDGRGVREAGPMRVANLTPRTGEVYTDASN